MRVVIIGAGTIAYRHAAACRDFQGAELVDGTPHRIPPADSIARVTHT